jgi:hypothetical protein
MIRFCALALIGAAALTASVDPAAAINCGPGMNSDGYRCFPAWQRHEYGGGYYGGHYRTGRHYRRGHVVNCGPGMNSDGYRCFPIGARRAHRGPGGGCYGPTGIYDPRGC